MALTAHDIASTILTVGFVLMWIGNGYIWYLICTDDLLGHIDNLFGWISTVTMLCSAVSGLLSLCYLALGQRILAHLKKRNDVHTDGDADGKDEEGIQNDRRYNQSVRDRLGPCRYAPMSRDGGL